MKFTKLCECCGHIETAYAHPLNRGLVLAFKQLCEYYLRTHKGCSIAKDLELNHNQIANFQKLRYFDLAIDTPEGWYPSERGIDWFGGEISILNPAGSFKNEVLPDYHEAWATHKKRTAVRITDYVDMSYKQRADYASEKSSRASTPSLF